MPDQTLLADVLLDRLPNGSVAVFDREYRYVFAGGEGLRAAGLSADYLTGRSLAELFPAPEVALAIRHYARAFGGEAPVFELITFGRHYAMAAGPLSRDDQGVSTIVVVAQDISDLINRPQALDALRDAVQQKDLLLATLGHEMRNPLGAMRMAVRLIREREERSVRDHARGVLERQIDLLERLVADVLGGLQAQQGTMQLHLAPVDMIEATLAAVESVRHTITQKDQQLHVGLPDVPVPPVRADRARVHQVLSNLLGNAARYTPVGGRIGVQLLSDADALEVVVTDTGCGIAPEDLATMFRPFTRGGRPPGDGGLGLGLWLAREIAVLHGGSIDAHSEGKGHGATFRFRLPRHAGTGSGRLP
jgi:signal transduction histidine kinase